MVCNYFFKAGGIVVRAIREPKSPGQRPQVQLGIVAQAIYANLGSLSGRFGSPNRPDNNPKIGFSLFFGDVFKLKLFFKVS